MGYLLLAILSSAMISITMRLSTGKVKGQFFMLATNYLICAILSALYADFSALSAQHTGLPITVGLGLINGAILPAGLVLLQNCTRKSGIVLSSIFMKLGLLVPFVISILFFQEVPTILQVAGFCIAITAIVLINLKGQKQASRFSLGLIFLLLANGGADAFVKIFEVKGPAALSDHFLLLSFCVAFLLCIGLLIRSREKFEGRALLFGALIGVTNFYSFKFLLHALSQVPAVVAFPTFSAATMLVVMLTGILFFREKLDKRQSLAFAAVIAALVMLNI
jgi:multidrug transporter EmrE-like cation transporter